MNYPDPCVNCKRKCDKGCLPWRIRYLHRQKLINAYAKRINPVQESLVTENPCDKCTQNESCDRICPARGKWWDTRIEAVKRMMGVGG